MQEVTCSATVEYDDAKSGWVWHGVNHEGEEVQSQRAFPHNVAAYFDARNTLACEPGWDDKGQQYWNMVRSCAIHTKLAPVGAPVFDRATGQTVRAVDHAHPDTPKLSQILPVGHPEREVVGR